MEAGEDHFRRARREYELTRILSIIPRASTVLEIGAGAGWQSRLLAENGHRVFAVDVPQGIYEKHQVWPVIKYDGKNLPFADRQFDVIYSSNVLEHVTSLEELNREMQRVLKPGGIAVHVLPTPMWRFWTNVTHYLYWVPKILLPTQANRAAVAGLVELYKNRKYKYIYVLRRLLFPGCHGIKGNFITELIYYRKDIWLKVFSSYGWSIHLCMETKLFNTGYSVLSNSLTLDNRALLSTWLGSSGYIYLLSLRA